MILPTLCNGKRAKRMWGLPWIVAMGMSLNFSSACSSQQFCDTDDGCETQQGGEANVAGASSDDMDTACHTGAGGHVRSTGGWLTQPGGAPNHPSGGMGGLGGTGADTPAGGSEAAPKAPRLIGVQVGGVSVQNGEVVHGLREGAQIVLRFSEPMEKLPTQLAYGSAQTAIKYSNVTFDWNDELTEMTVVPNTELTFDEVSDGAAPATLYTFRLSTVARSAEDLDLVEDFEASFSLLKRVTTFIMPDGGNSVVSADVGSSEPSLSEYRALPYLSAPYFYCGYGSDGSTQELTLSLIGYDIANPPTSDEWGYFVQVGATANLGQRNLGVISFPLVQIEAEEIEAADLSLAKWRSQGTNDIWAASEAEVFSVDALPSQKLTSETLVTPSLQSNLRNSNGDSYSLGYGVFSFDVTELLSDATERGDEWSMYRLEFDKMADWGDESADLRTMCAGLSLTVVYLAK